MENKLIEDSKKALFLNVEKLVAVFFSFLFSVIFLIKSPLHPWVEDVAQTDSSVFKTVALMMEKGFMPYKDSFDHKGPFLYIINFIGNKIAYYRGIWVIEVCFLAATLYWIYRIARLSCGKTASIVSTLLATTLLFVYFEGGNLAEEYAMPCIAISLYFFLDYLLNNRISRLRMIVSGIGLGIVLMLRPNMIAVWVVFCIYIFGRKMISKSFRDLREMIVFFMVGIAIIVLPIMLWLLINGDIAYFFHDYIVFNRIYCTPSIGAILAAFFLFAGTSMFTVSAFCLFYNMENKNQCSINIIYLAYMIVTVFFMVLSGKQSLHYGMIIIPAFVYPVSLLFKKIESIELNNIRKLLMAIVVMYSLGVLVIPTWNGAINDIKKAYATRDEKVIDSDEVMNSILDCVNRYTKSGESISVYGNWDIVYVLSKRRHATRYSFQFPIGYVMPEIMDEYFAQLQDELPKIIVVYRECHDERINDFILHNGYDLQYDADEEDDQSIEVYSR